MQNLMPTAYRDMNAASDGKLVVTSTLTSPYSRSNHATTRVDETAKQHIGPARQQRCILKHDLLSQDWRPCAASFSIDLNTSRYTTGMFAMDGSSTR